MTDSPKEQLLHNFLDWVGTQENIRAVALVGSAARLERPADEWSDYDLLVVAVDPQAYFRATDWLAAIGPVCCQILERNPAGEPVELRVLFEGSCDMDFIFASAEDARHGFPGNPMVREISQRGRRVLGDRGGLLPEIPASPASISTTVAPSEEEFTQVVSDFWFHVAWTAKKLRRGELWTAKRCCDVYLKDLLLRMMEWEARSVCGWETDTWFDGRFLEKWALPETLAELPHVFARYDTEEVWQALEATRQMFQRIAFATAGRLAYRYPEQADAGVSTWFARMQREADTSRS
jgi:aminoglycoside 6-adenylyltransferase